MADGSRAPGIRAPFAKTGLLEYIILHGASQSYTIQGAGEGQSRRLATYLAQRARQAPEEQAPLAEEAAAAARRAAAAGLDAQLAAHDHAVQGDIGQARDEQRVVHAQQDDQRRRVNRDGLTGCGPPTQLLFGYAFYR